MGSGVLSYMVETLSTSPSLEAPAVVRPGAMIAGRYQILKQLGSGSMGQVFLSCHTELAHVVAMKILFPEVARDAVASARFRNEIFAAYGVCHPNVVRAYEYLKEGELLAYTMEYVAGSDLADRLATGRAIPPSEAVQFLIQICAGLGAIHQAEIVHRDLKPENILITPQNAVKIADFGIARADSQPRITDHGGIVGTIDYVSPEYLLRCQLDARSDIYAVGILAYEMCTGDAPFRAESVYDTMVKRLKTDPVAPSLRNPDTPLVLDAIVLKAMARDPEKRYQSAAELMSDLLSVVTALGNDGGYSGSVRVTDDLRKYRPDALVYRPTLYQPLFLPTEHTLLLDAPYETIEVAPVEERGQQVVEEVMEPLEGAQKEITRFQRLFSSPRPQPREEASASEQEVDRVDTLMALDAETRQGFLDSVILLTVILLGVGIGVALVNWFHAM